MTVLFVGGGSMADFRSFVSQFITDPYMIDIVCGTVLVALTSAIIHIVSGFINFNN